ncbi:MAG: biotin synthase BioB [Nitrospirae bacterium]|nr:MAG: biotin synthase BioB [Nitrospirota bacterium]
MDKVQRILSGKATDEEEILEFVVNAPLHRLFFVASELRERTRGRFIDLCSIVNAKSGRCAEDCKYCAQSVHYRTDVKSYGLLEVEQILEAAQKAKAEGARRFCVVTSGKKPSFDELKKIASAIAEIKGLGLLPCATLGLLNREELELLKDAGLNRYHHNLETAESYFPVVCSTHSYEEKLRTIEAVKAVGLSLCSGGIFGLGESWKQRLEMAMELKRIGPDSVPVNFLIPIKGTPFGELKRLEPEEALRIVALLRIVLPDRQIRICGGRAQVLGRFSQMALMAGADGLLIGNYLTQQGISAQDDLAMLRSLGFTY